MGDLPDFTQSQFNSGATVSSGSVGVGSSAGTDCSTGQTVVVTASCSAPNTQLVLELQWTTDDGNNTLVGVVFVTAVSVFAERASVTVECPVYGGTLTVINGSSTPLTYAVVTEGRTIEVPRILDSAVPARTFLFTGNAVNGTAIVLPGIDSGGDVYPSNGNVSLNLQATVAGTMYVIYVDQGGTVRPIPLAVMTGTAAQTISAALPFGVVGFEFVPSATAAGVTVFAIVVRAQ